MSNLSKYTTMFVITCAVAALIATMWWLWPVQTGADVSAEPHSEQTLGGQAVSERSNCVLPDPGYKQLCIPSGLPDDLPTLSRADVWQKVSEPQGSLAIMIRDAVTAEPTIDGQMKALWDKFCPVQRQYRLYDRAWGIAGDEITDESLSAALEAADQSAQLYEVIIGEMIADGWEFPPSEDGWPMPRLFPTAVAEECA